MGFSYSFHLSSRGHSVSTTAKVSQCSRHNLREYKSEDYNKDNISILVGGDYSILQNMKNIYSSEFDEALKNYNENKRADRKIDDYLKHISDSKADVGAEIIIQVGDKDFWKNIDRADWKKLDKLFEKQLTKLQELVPEFKIASAVVHYDESSPHMHIVGVPVASGFKKGLEKQVSKTRVFTAEKLSHLQDKMRENVKVAMQDFPEFFENRQLKEKSKGRNKDLPKKLLEEFNKIEEEHKKNVENYKFEAEDWKKHSDFYMNQAFQNRDKTFDLEEKIEDLEFQERELSGLLVRINDETSKQAAFLDHQDEKINELEKTISSLRSEKKQLDQELEVSNMQLEEKNIAIKEKEGRLEALEEALEPIKANKVNITSITLRNGLKKENKTVVEGMTPSEVEKVFKLAEIVKKAYKIIQNAKDEAYELLKGARITKHKLEKEIEELKKEHFTWSTAKSDIQLRKIKEEHPEMFDKQGLYISKNEHEQNNLIIHKRDKGDR